MSFHFYRLIFSAMGIGIAKQIRKQLTDAIFVAVNRCLQGKGCFYLPVRRHGTDLFDDLL